MQSLISIDSIALQYVLLTKDIWNFPIQPIDQDASFQPHVPLGFFLGT